MTFGSTFGRVFSPTFHPKSQAAAASSWWLAGGIAAANCIAAYQPKGAASAAASYVNLNNPGTYDLADIFDTPVVPDWASATGYYYSGGNVGLNTGIAGNTKPITVISRHVCSGYAANRSIIGGASENGVLQYRVTTAGKLQSLVQSITAIGTSTSSAGTNDVVTAFTYSAAGAYAFYLNGGADGSSTNDKSFTKSSALAIGYSTNGDYFYGYIYALAIYSVVLDATTIAAVSTAMAAL